ncbi:probable 2' cyclic ADP-D-ribose synthase BdTIR [Cryptomeria japonica]|uniref:probable 2' cyclic ADP-D-ribose synthase BdTIR n=1 Tax=Cryptomeria japonica TaxID=3369 RepID=UPI0027DA91C0|nr:probable 2' cyclic ADP-D-ribose synthase BdTIR [Cryptomeria japonica]
MAKSLFRRHSSPLLSLSIPSYNYPLSTAVYDVFINHRGKETKQSVASLLYHNLQNKGFTEFLDQKSLQGGEYVPGAIRHAIRKASVHVAIFSPSYAESEWCLDELHLMLKTGAPIVPVFWEIQPSQLRMEDDNGVYARAFQKHKQAGKFDIGTLEEWRKDLRRVSLLEGFIYEG